MVQCLAYQPQRLGLRLGLEHPRFRRPAVLHDLRHRSAQLYLGASNHGHVGAERRQLVGGIGHPGGVRGAVDDHQAGLVGECAAQLCRADLELLVVSGMHQHGFAAGERQQRCGSLVYDLDARRFSLQEQPLSLTSREQAVLEALITRPGRVMSKDQLAAQVFGLDEDASADAIEIYIHRLRKKLEGSAVRIVTFRGLGYLLEAADA
mgnify:CR=1 FL=1